MVRYQVQIVRILMLKINQFFIKNESFLCSFSVTVKNSELGQAKGFVFGTVGGGKDYYVDYKSGLELLVFHS